MSESESIYNLAQKKKEIYSKENLYKSQFPYWIAPTGSTFNLKNTSFPDVSNLNGEFQLPRGGHPSFGKNLTIGRVSYREDPSNYHKKGETFKILPPLEKLHLSTEVRKPPVPKNNERPIMGLKSDQNFILNNVVDAILMEPKKIKEEDNNNIYKHKEFGKVPKYIKNYRLKIEEEYKQIKELQKAKKEEEESKRRVLTENELGCLREGLKKKWDMYNQRYGKMTHKKQFDNLVLLRNKEGLENVLTQIESDLKKLNSKNVIVDYTK